MGKKIFVYDTTLRDGSQAVGVSFSIEDKIRIAQKLDELKLDYIEGGYPGSNPKDRDFFRRMKEIPLKHARLSAFGMTHRDDYPEPFKDPLILDLLSADTPVVTLVGKSWDLQVTVALRGELDRHLQAIRETIRFFKKEGKEVIFDLEHFFDGMKNSPDFARRAIESALEGGADWLVLCDTNGGSLPWEVEEITEKVVKEFSCPVGIHTHNDSEVGVANALSAVRKGATQVQGTIGGIGERCGNANLLSIIANLSLKMGYETVPESSLRELTPLAHFLWEVLNEPLPPRTPFVGKYAFAHKGGMHISGVQRDPVTYEHIDPSRVGNRRWIPVSDLMGRSAVVGKLREMGMDLPPEDPRVEQIVKRVKEKEAMGYQYDSAMASFELLLLRELKPYPPFFRLLFFRVTTDHRPDGTVLSEATISVEVNGEVEHTASLGNGPVNALDQALRKALLRFYPELKDVELNDYKVRVLEGEKGTSACVRVWIEMTDGVLRWGTVGVSTNVLEASYIALTEGLQYKLLKVRSPDVLPA